MKQDEIGKQIVIARKKLNYTQRQVADKIGVSDKTVSKWERGVGCPDISLLLPLCEVLCIDVSQLLGKQKEASLNPEQQNVKQTVEYAKLKIVENQSKVKRFLFYSLLGLSSIALCICLLVDYVLSATFTWSIITTSSLLYAMAILGVMLLTKKYWIQKTLLCASLLLLPFLYIIAMQPNITGIEMHLFRSLATKIGLLSIAEIWIIYVIAFHARISLWYRAALIILVCVPFQFLVNIIVGDMQPYFWIQGGANIVVASILAFIGTSIKHKARKKEE